MCSTCQIHGHILHIFIANVRKVEGYPRGFMPSWFFGISTPVTNQSNVGYESAHGIWLIFWQNDPMSCTAILLRISSWHGCTNHHWFPCLSCNSYPRELFWGDLCIFLSQTLTPWPYLLWLAVKLTNIWLSLVGKVITKICLKKCSM